MSEWDIAKASGKCAVSGYELAEGESYYAVLFRGDEGFERADYREEHWTGPPDDAFCYWRARVPVREERKKQFVEDEVLMDFFDRLEGESEEARIQFRFVLTLILMRKRLLKYVREVNEGGALWWIMQPAGPFKSQHEEGATCRVLNPELDEDQIEEVSRQLGVILTGDFSQFDRPNEPVAEIQEGSPAVGESPPPGEAHA